MEISSEFNNPQSNPLFIHFFFNQGDLSIQEGAEEFICQGLEHPNEFAACAPYLDIKDDSDDKWNSNFA